MFKNNSLTDGPIARSIILFALPILISNIFQQLYNSIDTAVVGQYVGSAALAAVGGTASLINLLIGFFLGIATGTGVLFALRYGAGDKPGLKKLIDTSLIIGCIAGVFITFVGIVFCRRILLWMNTPDDVLPLAVTYLQLFFIGTIPNMIYNIGSGIIRAEGDSSHPLLYLFISGMTNMILDLLMVAVFKTGVVGAAVATVIAQVLSAVLVVNRLMRMDPEYRLQPHSMHADKETVREIIRIAVPCGLQGSMFNISNLLVQVKINSFGTVAMAGITAYTKIDSIGYTSTNALGMALSTFVGQNVGARNYRRIQKGMRLGMGMAIGLSLCITAIVLLTCKPLLGLFTTDPAAKAIGYQMMWYMIPFTWLLTFMDILGGSVRGSGQATAVTIISALCICAFRVVWLIIMLHFFNDLRIVFLCYPLSWLLNAIVMTTFYFKGSRLRRDIKADLARTA